MALASKDRRWSWLWFSAGLVAIAVASFVSFRALNASPHRAGTGGATLLIPFAEYGERAPHVKSALSIVGIQGAVRGGPAVPPPDEPPVSPGSFARPVTEYLAYSERQLAVMEAEVAALENALGSGDRAASQAAWRIAFARYLHLGAVYLEGPVSTLDREIDGGPGGLPGGTASPRFIGLHRIEFGLWTGAAPQTLVPFASRLAADVRAMRALLPGVRISPLDYATRAHEILEDAVRDLLSGTDVPWSGEGVLGTAAGLAATREVISTLKPLLHQPRFIDPPATPRSPAVVDADLDGLQSVLASLAVAHGGRLPTNQELTQLQAEKLDAAVGQALEALAQVPGMLETTVPRTTPSIPASAVRIDP
ncbi:MAG: EfeM/EfeO family lipoprotein [Solirubrobacteraceae bacterium]